MNTQRKNNDRFEYLQNLVTEFQDTDSDGEWSHWLFGAMFVQEFMAMKSVLIGKSQMIF